MSRYQYSIENIKVDIASTIIMKDDDTNLPLLQDSDAFSVFNGSELLQETRSEELRICQGISRNYLSVQCSPLVHASSLNMVYTYVLAVAGLVQVRTEVLFPPLFRLSLGSSTEAEPSGAITHDTGPSRGENFRGPNVEIKQFQALSTFLFCL